MKHEVSYPSAAIGWEILVLALISYAIKRSVIGNSWARKEIHSSAAAAEENQQIGTQNTQMDTFVYFEMKIHFN